MVIRFLIANAYSIGGTIRTTFMTAGQLARDHEVEIVSVYRLANEPGLELDPRVRLRTLTDLRPGSIGRGRRWAAERPSRMIHPDDTRYPRFNLLTDVALLRYLRGVRGGVLIGTRPALNLAIARHAHASDDPHRPGPHERGGISGGSSRGHRRGLSGAGRGHGAHRGHRRPLSRVDGAGRTRRLHPQRRAGQRWRPACAARLAGHHGGGGAVTAQGLRPAAASVGAAGARSPGVERRDLRRRRGARRVGGARPPARAPSLGPAARALAEADGRTHARVGLRDDVAQGGLPDGAARGDVRRLARRGLRLPDRADATS